MIKSDFSKRTPRIFSCFSFLLPVYVYLDIHTLIKQIGGQITSASALLSIERMKKRRKPELDKKQSIP